MKRGRNSISYEIKKNSINGAYDPNKADRKAKNKRRDSKYQGMKVIKNKDLQDYIEEKNWKVLVSENISDRIKNINKTINIYPLKEFINSFTAPTEECCQNSCFIRVKQESQKTIKQSDFKTGFSSIKGRKA